MPYIALYDTLINNKHTPKGAKVEFAKGTDSGYINRLVASGVIALESKQKTQDKVANESVDETEADESADAESANESADETEADESANAESASNKSAKGAKNSRKK